MTDWWYSLSGINRGFFCAAAFFSVFFVWQLIAALAGLDDDGADDVADGSDFDTNVGADLDDFDAGAADDASATVIAFQLLSIRTVITFCTLFTWGTALYMMSGVSLQRSMAVSSLWGLVGMLSIAFLLWILPRLAHTGTKRITTALGARGTVYLDIPANQEGQVRVAVSDTISYVKARARGATPLAAGTPVTVTRILGPDTVEVSADIQEG